MNKSSAPAISNWLILVFLCLIGFSNAACICLRGTISVRYLDPNFSLDGPLAVKMFSILENGIESNSDVYAMGAYLDLEDKLPMVIDSAEAKYLLYFSQSSDDVICLGCDRNNWERRSPNALVYRDTSDVERLDHNISWKAKIYLSVDGAPDKLLMEMSGCGSSLEDGDRPIDQFFKAVHKKQLI